ncbi:MAG: ribosome small subunit-dependent GTPase A [Candidatus Eremiobacteraeota bacterium]|nr:ribosome small subunit-dependent GTPase A [Candidatus Eremiobacteraeota bacterium]
MRPTDGGRRARVVSVGRNAAWIAFEDEDGLRLAALRKNVARTMLVPGDLVRATPLDAERVVIEGREPRTFSLERTTAGGRTKTMAANVDGIAIVAAFARPAIHFAMIDELLAFAEIHDIGARLLFTKADLAASEVDVGAVLAGYRNLGYIALAVNPKAGTGIDAVRAELGGHQTLLIGQSGVGKSSLFAALGGRADVGDVGKGGRGKQTTTAGRLHRFPGGFLIDSPGVGEFELRGCTPAEIALGFVEFAPLLGTCRFADCTHRSEPGCRVRGSVEAGAIASSRYASYLAMLEREAS